MAVKTGEAETGEWFSGCGHCAAQAVVTAAVPARRFIAVPSAPPCPEAPVAAVCIVGGREMYVLMVGR